MTIIQPQGELYILTDIPLDAEYNNTMDFDDEMSQQTYFQSKIAVVFDSNDQNKGYKFIRDNQSINVYANIDDLFGCNYLMYKNKNKWYYAFITRKDYVSPDVTRLIIKLDVLQSFMFDYEINESFIAREHQDRWRGTAGNLYPKFNNQPENIEIGNSYETKDIKRFSDEEYDNERSGTEWVIVKATAPLGQIMGFGGTLVDDQLPTSNIDNIPTGIYIYLFPINKKGGSSWKFKAQDGVGGNITSANVFGGNALINHLADNPSITSMQIFPQCPIVNDWDGDNNQLTFPNQTMMDCNITSVKVYSDSGVYTTQSLSIARIFVGKTSDYGISIKIFNSNVGLPNPSNSANITYESKLLTSPYTKMVINYDSISQDYLPENFSYSSVYARFVIIQSVLNTNNILIYPYNYLDENDNYNQSIETPINNDFYLSTDAWKEYEMNNKYTKNGSMVIAGVQSAINLGVGVATGGIGLAVAGTQAVNTGLGIASELMRQQDIKSRPDTPRVQGQDLYMNKLTRGYSAVIRMLSIKDEFKENVYKYFMHYGYACRDFKKPNTKSRYYYNYIQTIGCNLKSDIDNEYRDEIKSIYDKGITIWHYRDANTFKGVGNYDYENAEMTLIV